MLTIIRIPAPLLKEKLMPAANGNFPDEHIRKLAEQMRESMAAAKGIGLAANQVNENLRLFIIDKDLADKNGVPDVFINPEITEYSRDQDELEEGCLSIPEFYVPIRRPKKIKIKALDLNGRKIKLKARGFLARVLQHETDHLNGILIKDRFKKNKTR